MARNRSAQAAEIWMLARRTSMRGVSTGISVAAIALSVAVMLISIAVTSGFQQEIRGKLMGFEAPISIVPVASYFANESTEGIAISPAIAAAISEAFPEKNDSSLNVSVALRQGAVLKTDDDFLGIVIEMHSAAYEPIFERENIVEGCEINYSDSASANQIVISRPMASKLRLGVGDKVNAYFIGANQRNVKARRLEIKGIYESHFGDYDGTIAFAPLSLGEKIAGLRTGEGASIEIRGITDNEGIQEGSRRLHNALSRQNAIGLIEQPLSVDTILRSGAVYFNWLEMLDTNVVVILILMGCVCAFMLISCLLIMILQRVSFIGVLKALGATNAQIRGVFLTMGMRAVIAGLVIGNALTLGLICVQSATHFLPLDPSSYYLTFVPVNISFVQIGVLNIAVIGLSLLIMLLPATMISRISPASTMRYQ